LDNPRQKKKKEAAATIITKEVLNMTRAMLDPLSPAQVVSS
jgi:hypothetical protein